VSTHGKFVGFNPSIADGGVENEHGARTGSAYSIERAGLDDTRGGRWGRAGGGFIEEEQFRFGANSRPVRGGWVFWAFGERVDFLAASEAEMAETIPSVVRFPRCEQGGRLIQRVAHKHPGI